MNNEKAREHEEGRNFVRGLSGAISDYTVGKSGAAEEIIRNARGYTNLLRRHIDREDQILFGMAVAEAIPALRKIV